jgi:signal transduction histidine kinase
MAESTLRSSSVSSPDVKSSEVSALPSENATPEISAQLQLEFIQEIRIDRLNILWKGTLIGVVLITWLVLVLSSSGDSAIVSWLIPVGVIGISSYATRTLLIYRRYEFATWAYTLGIIITVSVMLIPDNEQSHILVPMIGIVVIFIVGMLMSVQNTVILLGISYVAMLGLPLIFTGKLVLEDTGSFAFLLMAVVALIVTQISGELYSITNWALSSYRKERQTAVQLHESREAVEKSLLKQQNLTLQIQDVNVALDEARNAAEVAKHFRGQFLANMSHELRTPLNAVIGFSETMLTFPAMYNDTELPSEYHSDLQQIHTSGKHLLSIINDILDLSKIDVGRLEVSIQPVDLDPIIKGVLSTAMGLIGGKPIQLRRETPDVLPMVLGDSLRVRQVLLNLYSNAAKFTEEGEITLYLTQDNNHVTISVADTGPGIEAENIDRIFEAFQQGRSGVKQQRAGAGLGLAISLQLLALMDGSISVDSELGHGATFHITIPRYHPPTIDEEWMEVEEV